MKLNQIGSNQTEVDLGNGTKVFFSYQTPVAANVLGNFYRTAEHFSVTTSKHINRWLHGIDAQEKPQSFFAELVK